MTYQYSKDRNWWKLYAKIETDLGFGKHVVGI